MCTTYPGLVETGPGFVVVEQGCVCCCSAHCGAGTSLPCWVPWISGDQSMLLSSPCDWKDSDRRAEGIWYVTLNGLAFKMY